MSGVDGVRGRKPSAKSCITMVKEPLEKTIPIVKGLSIETKKTHSNGKEGSGLGVFSKRRPTQALQGTVFPIFSS